MLRARGQPVTVHLLCGICQRPAVWMATVPMCGQRPRYPLCEEHLDDLAESEYVEEVELA